MAPAIAGAATLLPPNEGAPAEELVEFVAMAEAIWGEGSSTVTGCNLMRVTLYDWSHIIGAVAQQGTRSDAQHKPQTQHKAHSKVDDTQRVVRNQYEYRQ